MTWAKKYKENEDMIKRYAGYFSELVTYDEIIKNMRVEEYLNKDKFYTCRQESRLIQ